MGFGWFESRLFESTRVAPILQDNTAQVETHYTTPGYTYAEAMDLMIWSSSEIND